MKTLKKVNEILMKNDVNEGLELRYTFINELISFRKKNNLTQKEFAERLGLKQQAIARFEKGEIDPRISFIAKILEEINLKIVKEDIEYTSIKINSKAQKEVITKKELLAC